MSLSNRVIWTWLRQSRSEPPGLAAEDSDRRLLFQSAMQQFEDLITAANSTGPSGRPLPLFYALSQASQAIIAVRGGEPPSRHGLEVNEAGFPILTTVIHPHPEGNFLELARVLGSPVLSVPTTLGGLLYSLPELSGGFLPMKAAFPQAAFLWQDTGNHAQLMAGRVVYSSVVVDPLPTTWLEAHEAMSIYPTAQKVSWQFPVESHLPAPGFQHTPFGPGISVIWEVGRPDEVAPEYRWLDRRWLRPAIHESEPPSPICTWWAVLFALSMLARYYPTSWTTSLDMNRSPEAVTLELVMEEALEAIPQLVLEAIGGRSVLLPAPDLR